MANPSRDHVEPQMGNHVPGSEHHISRVFEMLKSRVTRRHSGFKRASIPEFPPQSPEYRAVYETILNAVEKRSKANETPRVVVITDLAKDFDDLLAMIVLKELHRLGAIQLLGFVANLNPARKRALLGRGALDRLGLPKVKIAVGSQGEDKCHEVLDYEFAGSENFIASEDTDLPDGQALLKEIFTKAKQEKYKVTFLGLSSLMDIAEFIRSEPDLVKGTLERVVLQGGYSVVTGKLEADSLATNNHFSLDNAQYFHQYLQDHAIPSICFTKVATFATPIYQTLLMQMASTEIDIAQYLRAVQLGQDLYFYKCASGPPEGRFRPFMDEPWFLKNKTTWYDKNPGMPGPKGDKIEPWLNKVTAYDCLAAIGAAGKDVLDALGVIKPLEVRLDAEHTIHKSVGVLSMPDPNDPSKKLPEEANIHGEKFAIAIQALALGSLRAVKQGLVIK